MQCALVQAEPVVEPAQETAIEATEGKKDTLQEEKKRVFLSNLMNSGVMKTVVKEPRVVRRVWHGAKHTQTRHDVAEQIRIEMQSLSFN